MNGGHDARDGHGERAEGDTAGNGMANHGHGASGDGAGADDRTRPLPGLGGGSADDAADVSGDLGNVLGGAPSGDLSGDFDADELQLRSILQGAVRDLQPSDGALDHLRTAVPRRRARKRQALVGAAAAVVLLGTGVPAFLVAGDTGTDGNAVNVGHGQHAQGGNGDDGGGTGGEQAAGSPSGELGGGSSGPAGGGGPGGSARPEQSRKATAGASEGTADNGTSDPSTAEPEELPACTAGQLGVVSATTQPGGNGVVYGTFRIGNVSGSDCAVKGPGSIGFRVGGAAGQDRITAVRHAGGGPAADLPGPSAYADGVALKPSAAYEIRFAWVPADSCPVEGGATGEPSTTPSEPETPPEDGTGTTGETGGDGGTAEAATGMEAQLVTEEEPTRSEGSVTVTHTAQPGAPTAEATITQACAGTIYHTGLLPTQ
ncbi:MULTISPECIES: hypothetical protein [unclassified Streptomyces]|uniref:hypothetical protein n=1 Tax=unclassified Streptomyces TaxID=2593676 RepID=UPI0009A11F21|nr:MULTISPECIES: hypothetical protein [unclassified Streptomyces]